MALLQDKGPSRPITTSPSDLDRFVDHKSKLEFTRTPEKPTPLLYSSSEAVELQTATRVCGTYDSNGVLRTFVPSFKLGAAVGADPRLFSAPFDGIIGLGRSHPGRSHLGTPGLLQQLLNQNCIQDEKFYVCYRWEPDREFGYGFISFGGWPDDRHETPAWKRIPVVSNAGTAMWILRLEMITITIPGTSYELKQPVNADVMLDSGTPGTTLPQIAALPLQVAVSGLQLKGEGLDGGLPDDVQVAFTFEATDRRNRLDGHVVKHTVCGSAKKFFVSSKTARGANEEPYCPLGFS
ncbi:hypothetical protein AURDEDRAFT_116725, partial [Auricularia subglabra TFB-10046 SS5]